MNLLTIFKEHISEQARAEGRQYSLPIMMYLSVIAILMGAKNPMEINRWMKINVKRKEIKRLLGVEFFKAPGKSRMYDFFEIVDKEELELAFRKWIGTFIDIPENATLAVDGKVLRGSAIAHSNSNIYLIKPYSNLTIEQSIKACVKS